MRDYSTTSPNGDGKPSLHDLLRQFAFIDSAVVSGKVCPVCLRELSQADDVQDWSGETAQICWMHALEHEWMTERLRALAELEEAGSGDSPF